SRLPDPYNEGAMPSLFGLSWLSRNETATSPFLEGNFAPYRQETTTDTLEVIKGSVPRELAGALYRIGPAPQFDPINPALYHWFDGDGMVDGFYLDAGRVSHRRRWVRTSKWQMENRAGRALFGGLRDLAPSTRYAGWKALGLNALDLLIL